jgi:hypothetical protein
VARRDPPVATFDGLEDLRGHAGVVARIGVDECLLHLGDERALIAVERQHVIAALGDDLLGDLGTPSSAGRAPVGFCTEGTLTRIACRASRPMCVQLSPIFRMSLFGTKAVTES